MARGTASPSGSPEDGAPRTEAGFTVTTRRACTAYERDRAQGRARDRRRIRHRPGDRPALRPRGRAGAVLDVAEPAARDVAREIEACGGAGLAVPCDVSRQADVQRAFQA